VMPRRAAHWVQTVTRPPASTAASRSGSRAECGRSNSAARPGRANQADSPVSQSETGTPPATAVAATVNACAQRSGASDPAVALTTRVRGMFGRIAVTMVTEIGFVSLLVAGLGALAGGVIYLAVRVSRGRW